jgi:hypothetical protein
MRGPVATRVLVPRSRSTDAPVDSPRRQRRNGEKGRGDPQVSGFCTVAPSKTSSSAALARPKSRSLRDLHVRGLEIAMDDSSLVRGLESFRDLPRDLDGLLDRNRAARQPLREVFPFDQLQRETDHAIRFSETVNRGDVRMIEPTRRPALRGGIAPRAPCRARTPRGAPLIATSRFRRVSRGLIGSDWMRLASSITNAYSASCPAPMAFAPSSVLLPFWSPRRISITGGGV